MITHTTYKFRAGFTLIELLVVTVMFGIVSAAIAACLAGGMRAWESVQNFNALELNVLPGLDEMEEDVVNSIQFYDIDFEGGEQEMQFASVISVESEDDTSKTIGAVNYSYDPDRRILVRKQWPYMEEEGESADIIMTDLDDILFEYLYVSPYGVMEEWGEYSPEQTNLLSAVRVKIVCGVGEEEKELSRTLILPIPRIRGRTDDEEGAAGGRETRL